jgi:uncharacterized protein YacL
MNSPHSVNVARLTYLLVCEAAGVAIALSTRGTSTEVSIASGLLIGLAVAAFFIWVETLMKGFTLRGFSTATFGLGVGLFCAWLLTRVEVATLLEISFRDRIENPESFRLAIDVGLFASLGFLGAALAVRGNRDDFAVIIPYVRFRQDAASGQPVVLDPQVVMDGRVPAIFRAGFLNGRLIVPRFVLEILQEMAGSEAESERHRARRGLEWLEQMQRATDIQLSIHDVEPPAAMVSLDTRLIETARLLGARLMTLDANLTKVAKLQGIDVLNIVELDEALKPQVAVGERLRVPLVRSGKDDHQAVAYLADGTMIVVNHAAQKIGSTVDVIVISTLQTASGTLVFAELYAGS